MNWFIRYCYEQNFCNISYIIVPSWELTLQHNIQNFMQSEGVFSWANKSDCGVQASRHLLLHSLNGRDHFKCHTLYNEPSSRSSSCLFAHAAKNWLFGWTFVFYWVILIRDNIGSNIKYDFFMQNSCGELDFKNVLFFRAFCDNLFDFFLL